MTPRSVLQRRQGDALEHGNGLGVRQMIQVPARDGCAGVPEQLAYDRDRCPGHLQLDGKGVPKGMRMDTLLNSGFSGKAAKERPDVLSAQRLTIAQCAEQGGAAIVAELAADVEPASQGVGSARMEPARLRLTALGPQEADRVRGQVHVSHPERRDGIPGLLDLLAARQRDRLLGSPRIADRLADPEARPVKQRQQGAIARAAPRGRRAGGDERLDLSRGQQLGRDVLPVVGVVIRTSRAS